jgi:hypothetical protein
MVTAISWRAHPTEICTTPVSPVSIFSLLPIHFQIPTARARPVSTPPGDLGHLRAQYSRNHLRGRYDTAHRRIRYVKIRETPGRTAPLYHLPCLTSQLAKKSYRTVRDISKLRNPNHPTIMACDTARQFRKARPLEVRQTGRRFRKGRQRPSRIIGKLNRHSVEGDIGPVLYLASY